MAQSDRGLISILRQFKHLGVSRVVVKELARNDNSKNQIYVGSSFRSLNLIPVRQVSPIEPTRRNEKKRNFKAKLDWSWLGRQAHIPAPRTQLILYPAYPEVRISGFLDDCTSPETPSNLLSRRLSGRIMILGIAGGRIYAYVGGTNSKLATMWKQLKRTQTDWKLEWKNPTNWKLCEVRLTKGHGGFYQFEFVNGKLRSGSIRDLLERLQQIHRHGFHSASRLTAEGKLLESKGQNAGGNTLESLFGIASNAKKEPDYLGWELKNIDAALDRVTLVTPEPRGGLYGEKGVAEFVRRYGYKDKKRTNRKNFASPHYLSKRNAKTKLTLGLEGYSFKKREITGNDGGIVLRTSKGKVAAKWNFVDLMHDWNHKHSRVIFVPSTSTLVGGKQYSFQQFVTIAEQSDFLHFLKALREGRVFFDPGTNVVFKGHKTKVHARSQFRSKTTDLRKLYRQFRQVSVCKPMKLVPRRSTN